MQPYTVRRSERRKKTVAAFREAGNIVLAVPAHMPQRDIAAIAPGLIARLLQQEENRRAPRDDTELHQRAVGLFRRVLEPQVGPCPNFSMIWVSNQSRRWGSCTVATGQIRLSHVLQSMPTWVVDYVIVHELAHLFEPSHNARFQELVSRYPDSDRARGFLLGYQYARDGSQELDF